MSDESPRARVGGVVAEVVRQAVRDAGAYGVVVMDDDSPEARLVHEWCTDALGASAVVRVALPDPTVMESCRAAWGLAGCAADLAGEEVHRLRARLEACSRDALVAHPANKTALLLRARVPPEPLLPLGDLYASQVDAMAGGWSGPPELLRLVERAGGVAPLDAALYAWLEGRKPLEYALEPLGGDVAAAVRLAIEAGRFARRRIGLVPKLGGRTLGIDLFG